MAHSGVGALEAEPLVRERLCVHGRAVSCGLHDAQICAGNARSPRPTCPDWSRCRPGQGTLGTGRCQRWGQWTAIRWWSHYRWLFHFHPPRGWSYCRSAGERHLLDYTARTADQTHRQRKTYMHINVSNRILLFILLIQVISREFWPLLKTYMLKKRVATDGPGSIKSIN